MSAWCLVLAAWELGLGLALGAIVGFPSPGAGEVAHVLGVYALAVSLTVALQTAIAFAASAGRGYLAPAGCALVSLFLAQILAATGWGACFPWSIPALLTGIAGPEGPVPGIGSLLLVVLTSLAGFTALLAWWSHAEH